MDTRQYYKYLKQFGMEMGWDNMIPFSSAAVHDVSQLEKTPDMKKSPFIGGDLDP